MTGNMQPRISSGARTLRRYIDRLVARRYRLRVNWQERGSLKAYIQGSQWFAPCPFCKGALVVQPGTPYFCPDCMMQGNGGFSMTVIFPDNRKDIEASLLKRWQPERRHWKAQTVEELEEENIDLIHQYYFEEKENRKGNAEGLIQLDEMVSSYCIINEYPLPEGLEYGSTV